MPTNLENISLEEAQELIERGKLVEMGTRLIEGRKGTRNSAEDNFHKNLEKLGRDWNAVNVLYDNHLPTNQSRI